MPVLCASPIAARSGLCCLTSMSKPRRHRCAGGIRSRIFVNSMSESVPGSRRDFHRTGSGRDGMRALAFISGLDHRPERCWNCSRAANTRCFRTCGLGHPLKARTISTASIFCAASRAHSIHLVPALLGPFIEPNFADIHRAMWVAVRPRARPMEPRTSRRIAHACRRQEVTFFFKQWGGKRKNRTGRLLERQADGGYSVVGPA